MYLATKGTKSTKILSLNRGVIVVNIVWKDTLIKKLSSFIVPSLNNLKLHTTIYRQPGNYFISLCPWWLFIIPVQVPHPFRPAHLWVIAPHQLLPVPGKVH